VRITDSLEHTSTFKSRKVELRSEGFEKAGGDPVFVLTDRQRGYVPLYDGYLADVASGTFPRL
jgi:fatty-acyl-CoA synthase